MPLSRACAVLVLPALLAWTSSALGQDSHAGHAAHHQPDAVTAQPAEAGQGAFAAIAEIVAMLEADPETDWSTVNVSALRDHLVDMNALTLEATVSAETLADGLVMTVTGEGRTREAIQRMVPAHAGELDKMVDWSASAETVAEGAKLTVTSPDPAVQAKIRGLGFFGLMASGSHHQPHHLAMARGQPMHGGH